MERARFDRRSVLALAGGTAAALAGCTDGGNGAGGSATRIELGGETAGWTGRAPSEIEGTTNPTLQLGAGETYELVWENRDGAEHELVVESEDGGELQATDAASEAGATRSMTFTASEEMAAYYCEYHPQSMRGEVAVDLD